MRRGYLAEAELPEFLARCTFLALPYTQASQSGAGSRAIGHGVPLLVSRLGGLPDLALDASWTVPPGDPDALAAAIVRGLDAGADVRREVLDRVARPRSWQAAAQRTLEVYRELLARRGRLHA
jgi:glycosyltransferase involved in cell wall biosynthesis